MLPGNARVCSGVADSGVIFPSNSTRATVLGISPWRGSAPETEPPVKGSRLADDVRSLLFGDETLEDNCQLGEARLTSRGTHNG